MHQPSGRQQDILNEWDNTENNILIGAVAGSGKTSTLLLLLERCEYKTLFVAFNKAIQEDIQKKIDERGLKQGKAMTMHSLGLSAIKAMGKRFIINNSKNWAMIKKLQLQYKKLFKSMEMGELLKVSYSLIDINDISRMYLTNDLDEIRKYMLSMDKVVSDSEHLPMLWESFVEIRDESYESPIIEIDFSDMIYLPVKKNLTIPVHPYYLMLDECQDLNLAQHKLIDNLISQGAIRRWIAVGDRNQAIYGFAGANASSFDLFLNKADNVKEMPLDICYRCAADIVSSANEVYPVMRPAKHNSGIVENRTIEDLEDIKPNSMVICRNTTPLFAIYFKLLGLNKPCYINGNEIMAYLLKFLKPYSKDTVHSATIEMEYKLAEFEESEESTAQEYFFRENYNNFRSVAENICNPTDSIDQLIERLKHLFENRTNAIMLCTIHKSKGLESDVVYILNENLIPSKFAKSPEQLRQEMNLKYVARTRAREELYFLNVKLEEGKLIDVNSVL